MTLKSINRYLLCAGILLLPLFGFKEFLYTINLYTPDLSNPLNALSMTSPFIKEIKDLLLFFICLNFAVYYCIGRKTQSIKIPDRLTVLFAVYIIFEAILIFLRTNLLDTLLSIRSFMPLILIVVSYNFINSEDMRSIKKSVILIACLEALLGTIQFIFGKPVFGHSPLGFGTRISGTYFVCQSMGLFFLLGIIFLLADDLNTYLKKILFVLFSFFIILTGSATSIIGLFFAIIIKNYYKSRRLFGKDVIVILLIILMPILLTTIPALSGRGAAIYQDSGYNRLKIFSNLINNTNSVSDLLIGHGLGYGSNFIILASLAGQIEQNEIVKSFSTDSFYTSYISQIGLIGLLLFLTLNLYAWYHSFKQKYMLGIIMIPVFLLTGFTAIFTEHFPINWVYPIVLGYIYKQDNCNTKI